MTTSIAVVYAVASAALLGFSVVENLTILAMIVIGVAAAVGTTLGVVANLRMDEHLRETHKAASEARETIHEIISTAGDTE